jgi:hypothetical protein
MISSMSALALAGLGVQIGAVALSGRGLVLARTSVRDGLVVYSCRPRYDNPQCSDFGDETDEF